MVTATDWMGRESADSIPASAMPALPQPTTPTNIIFSATVSNLTLEWPQDYTGWILQVQTNSLTGAWLNGSGSSVTNLMVVPIDPASPGLCFRLVHP